MSRDFSTSGADAAACRVATLATDLQRSNGELQLARLALVEQAISCGSRAETTTQQGST